MDPLDTLHGNLPDGRPVRLFTLTHANGLRARITESGAALVSLDAPDRHGRFADITLGGDTFAGYADNPFYLGATAGRFANRIANARFPLDGREVVLPANNAPGGIPCHLHGGFHGFGTHLWSGRRLSPSAVRLERISPDGEEGYPGNLAAAVLYELTGDHELVIRFEATTDRPTIVNLCNHSYWNLSGDPARTILDHELTLRARRYLPVNDGLIPEGGPAPVAGTPMDFTSPERIGRRIDEPFPGLLRGNGYDHCWVIDGEPGVLREAAILHEPVSGRTLTLSTDQPGVQVYSGNFLDGSLPGKGGVPLAFRTGLCLETQRFPDTPNQPGFGSAILRPGETYTHHSRFRLGVA